MKLAMISIVVSIVFVGCSRPGAEEMFNKGVDAQKAEQYDSAIDAYRELIKAYPDSARTPEAYYAIATIYQNQKKSYHEAVQTYREVVDKFPDHATAPSACFLIGFIYNNDLKNVDSARLAYQDFIRKFPTNPLVVSAQFELANLGKSPDDILKEQTKLANKETKQIKKGKRK